jgi:PadR family transcriptional regulator PadR
LGSPHGYGVLLRIQQISRGVFEVEQGALYPALYRLEERGMLASEWGVSDNNRRAKYYRLTRKGEKRLREQTDTWNRLAAAMATVLDARPEEV